MPFSYSQDTLSQRTLNTYAIVIFLPPALDENVQRLRERYDPDFGIIRSHICIAFPFETGRGLDEIATVVSALVRQVDPFNIELGNVADFYPTSPIIYWEVKRCPELDYLYKNFYARLDLPLPYKAFCPHVTVGREISDHRVLLVKDKIASYLSAERFAPAALDLVAPISDGNWVSVRTFPLLPRESS